MAYIENRGAENGSLIINDTALHSLNQKTVIAIRILEDTTTGTVTSSSAEGAAAYYNGKAMTNLDPVILGDFDSITLSVAGAVQVIYA